MNPIIEIEDLNYGFSPKKLVLKNVHLSVPQGSIYGFIGANGAGKSTTMRAILGVYPEVASSIRVFGQPIADFYPGGYRKIGTLIDYPAFYEHLSGWDNLTVLARLNASPLDNREKVLRQVDMWEARHMKMKRYSLGMKQRLAIAMALLNDPELLILDEPVNGLDPNGMIEIRQLLVELNKKQNTTLFISSHLLQELEKMVTHLAILSQGEIKFQGSIHALKSRYGFDKAVFNVENARAYLDFIDGKFGATLEGEDNILLNTSAKADLADINRVLVEKGAKVYSMGPIEGFEKWFSDITKVTQ